MNLQRIDKIIASQFNISRTDAKSDIRKGFVTVDSAVLRDPSRSVNPETARICYKGQALCFKEHIYILMNKPKGVLSASNDKRRQTVVDLVPENLFRAGLFPVGRLDKDTTGLLIITDDGDFAHKVISPKSGINKMYDVILDGAIDETALKQFDDGIILADGTKCLPARLQIIEENRAMVEIKEGKYHQIKRMFGVIGLGVNELKRVSIGNLRLPKDLEYGSCIELTEDDLKAVLQER